ncbi:MAG: hypothetical protein AAFQ63_18410, partial [Cyanobacteria bacterium J06621_11]
NSSRLIASTSNSFSTSEVEPEEKTVSKTIAETEFESLSEIVSGAASGSTSEVENEFEVEAMSRELFEIVDSSRPESRFASEVRDRTQKGEITPIRLPLAQIDAFTESAVRWVLKDLSSQPVTKASAPLSRRGV